MLARRLVASAAAVANRSAARRMMSTAPRIDASALVFEQTKQPKPHVAKEKLTFGAVTSDHMLEVDWTAKAGWEAPRITPYHPLAIDPAASCLHYGLQAFEGMKAYLDPKGRARLFRPDLNMKRLAGSMAKLALPALDQEGFLACIKRLVAIDKGWIPTGEGYSLYLRPTVIATWPYLGVNQAQSCKLYCIACPVGPYYPEGFKPVKLLADTHHVRAWPGGTGDAKLGGNYAPTIRVQAQAATQGFNQILWLFGDEGQVTEVGAMNMFIHLVNKGGQRELVTPPLDGLVLPGVTRQSILDLTRQWGEFTVSERRITMAEVAEAANEGRLLEAFGAGTAVVISPVKQISWRGVDYKIPLDPADPTAGAGPLARRVWDALLGIQYGKTGEHPWSVAVE